MEGEVPQTQRPAANLGHGVALDQGQVTGDISVDQLVDNPALRSLLKARGIHSLRPLQAKAIRDGLFFNASFLVCTPSGSGKTLVGELAVANAILEFGKRAAFLVPYKALAHEKYRLFRRSYGPLGVTVRLAMGDVELSPAELDACDLLVTTFEKLDSILRTGESAWASSLNTVVVDEVHVLGDGGRGARLESLLVRLTRRFRNLQLICLSATVANPREFLSWLSTLTQPFQLVEEDERPVPLLHEVVTSKKKANELAKLLHETLGDGGQLLVFLNSRKGCVTTAEKLARHAALYLTEEDARECHSEAKRLEKIPGGFEPLARLLSKGIGIHHAGLNLQERRCVERLYFHRHLKVICCTSTLAAGINLPARRVVLNNFEQVKRFSKVVGLGTGYLLHPTKGFSFKPVPRNRVHQILGRAGRPGLDDVGFGVVLVSSPEERAWVENYYFERSRGTPRGESALRPRYDPLESCLRNEEVLAEQLLVHAVEAGSLTIYEISEFLSRSYFWHLSVARGQVPPGVDPCQELKVVGLEPRQIFDRVVPAALSSLWPRPRRYVESLVVTSASSSSVEFALQYLGMRFACRFHAEEGPWCSCRGKPFKDDAGLHPLCIHLALVLDWMSERPPGERKALVSVTKKALYEESVLEWLVESGFLEERVDDGGTLAYRPTKFGRVCARGYVLPSEAVAIRDCLRDNSLETVEDVLEAVVERYHQRRGDDAKKGSVYALLWRWMEEIPLSKLMASGTHSLGDLHAIREEVNRIVGSFRLLAAFFGRERVSERCQVLSLRLVHGVKEDLFDLVVRLRGVGRVKGRALVAAGYRSVTDLAGVTLYKLVQRTGLSPQDCESILNQAAKITGTERAGPFSDFMFKKTGERADKKHAE
ncbi:MAG: hypothetical protein Kow0069_34000 [Promethearchaeota archaeon]